MGHVTHGIPLDLATRLVESQQLRAAVETGTFRGDTTLALRALVNEVWTVEADHGTYLEVAPRLVGQPGIHRLEGSSDTVLASIAPELTMPALYWLDAHSLPWGHASSPSSTT